MSGLKCRLSQKPSMARTDLGVDLFVLRFPPHCPLRCLGRPQCRRHLSFDVYALEGGAPGVGGEWGGTGGIPVGEEGKKIPSPLLPALSTKMEGGRGLVFCKCKCKSVRATACD